MILGINASRARSGGARTHLIGILSAVEPSDYGFSAVHVWSYQSLLDALPNRSWLIGHAPPALERGLLSQFSWERWQLPGAFASAGCAVLLNVDAGTVARQRPAVTMSRDMLSYETGEMKRYGFKAQRFRLLLLRFMQNNSLRAAEGAIFLTRYAAKEIQKSCGPLRNVAHVPHGVSDEFRNKVTMRPWPSKHERPIECLYISPVWRFKHQNEVVRAIAALRRQGHDITLKLAGGGEPDTILRLDSVIDEVDPKRSFVQCLGNVPHSKLPELIANSDMFVFASSCENMPNTVLEAMAVGLPIACSDRGPMPEVAEDGAVYFDPEDVQSIKAAIAQIIDDEVVRKTIAKRSKTLADAYSWTRCAKETFIFLADTAKRKAAV